VPRVRFRQLSGRARAGLGRAEGAQVVFGYAVGYLMSSQTPRKMFNVFTDTRRDVLCLHRHRARCFMSSQTSGEMFYVFTDTRQFAIFQPRASQAGSSQDFGMESVASVATVPAKGRSGSGGRFGSRFRDGIGCLCRHCSSKRPVRLRRSIRVRISGWNRLPLSPLFQQKAGQAQAIDSGQVRVIYRQHSVKRSLVGCDSSQVGIETFTSNTQSRGRQ
jgi:hypothetical protein